jgi:hypothetical protein
VKPHELIRRCASCAIGALINPLIDPLFGLAATAARLPIREVARFAI